MLSNTYLPSKYNRKQHVSKLVFMMKNSQCEAVQVYSSKINMK